MRRAVGVGERLQARLRVGLELDRNEEAPGRLADEGEAGKIGRIEHALGVVLHDPSVHLVEAADDDGLAALDALDHHALADGGGDDLAAVHLLLLHLHRRLLIFLAHHAAHRLLRRLQRLRRPLRAEPRLLVPRHPLRRRRRSSRAAAARGWKRRGGTVLAEAERGDRLGRHRRRRARIASTRRWRSSSRSACRCIRACSRPRICPSTTAARAHPGDPPRPAIPGRRPPRGSGTSAAAHAVRAPAVAAALDPRRPRFVERSLERREQRNNRRRLRVERAAVRPYQLHVGAHARRRAVVVAAVAEAIVAAGTTSRRPFGGPSASRLVRCTRGRAWGRRAPRTAARARGRRCARRRRRSGRATNPPNDEQPLCRRRRAAVAGLRAAAADRRPCRRRPGAAVGRSRRRRRRIRHRRGAGGSGGVRRCSTTARRGARRSRPEFVI